MIKKLEVNKTYYTGVTYPPFFEKIMCTVINKDGTYGNDKHRRASCVSTAEAHWCYTKEGAVESMKSYYMSQFFRKDMTDKSDIYQKFYKNMTALVKEENPEYWL